MIPAQICEARALLGLTQEELADMADLNLSTIQDIEAGRQVNGSLVDAVLVTLEAAGVEFVPGNDGGTGVRLRK
jgi:transcriptional regulator with XRE-family HTH domain